MKKLVLGIDVGGTNIKIGLINSTGKIIARSNLITGSFGSNKIKLIDGLVEKSRELLSQKNLKFCHLEGIGIGLPGLINPLKGRVIFLPNVPGWSNVPLASIIKKKTHVPTFIENDVNLITLGEWKFGAGKGIKNMLCITLGTGVGGGLILNNQLYRGEGFAAGEIGHMPLNEKGPMCNCGGHACFERYVGNQWLMKDIHRIFKNKKLGLEDVHSLAVKGNKKAIRFWNDVGIHIGNGLAGVVNLLNPTHIIIGGGIANTQKILFKSIRETIKARAMRIQGRMIRIKRAQLGNDAGIIGARELVANGFQS